MPTRNREWLLIGKKETCNCNYDSRKNIPETKYCACLNYYCGEGHFFSPSLIGHFFLLQPPVSSLRRCHPSPDDGEGAQLWDKLNPIGDWGRQPPKKIREKKKNGVLQHSRRDCRGILLQYQSWMSFTSSRKGRRALINGVGAPLGGLSCLRSGEAIYEQALAGFTVINGHRPPWLFG